MTKKPLNEIKEYLIFITDRYLGVRPRSIKEMRDYYARKLKRYNLSDEETQTLIEERIISLLATSLLDDEAFARWYVAEKSHFKHRGTIRLLIEMKRKGIPDELIEQALSTKEEQDVDIIKHLLLTKYRSYNMNSLIERQRAQNGLLRRGFSFRDIKTALEENDPEE